MWHARDQCRILCAMWAVLAWLPQADAVEYLETEESVHSHVTAMDAWFDGKAEVYVSDGLSARISGSLASGNDLTEAAGAEMPVNAVFSGDSIRLFEM